MDQSHCFLKNQQSQLTGIKQPRWFEHVRTRKLTGLRIVGVLLQINSLAFLASALKEARNLGLVGGHNAAGMEEVEEE